MNLGAWPGQALVGLSEGKREATLSYPAASPTCPREESKALLPKALGNSLAQCVLYTETLLPSYEKAKLVSPLRLESMVIRSLSLFLGGGVEETH